MNMFFNLQFASGLGRFFCFLFFGPLTARLFSTRKIHSSHWRTNLVGRSFLRSYNSPKFLTGTNASPDFRKGNFWGKKQIFGPSYSTNMDCFNVFFPNKHNFLLIYLSAYNLKILVFTCGLAEAKLMITRNLAVESFMFSLSSSNIQPMSHPLAWRVVRW